MLNRREFIVAVALVTLAGPASAADTVDVAKAKAEGKVVWYTSTPLIQGQKIVGLFEKEYGIKVEAENANDREIFSLIMVGNWIVSR